MRWPERAATMRMAAVTATGTVVAWLRSTASAAAADPSASAVPGGDPRSSGAGPGLVGDPLFAIAVVVGIGVLALVASLAYVQATGGSRGR